MLDSNEKYSEFLSLSWRFSVWTCWLRRWMTKSFLSDETPEGIATEGRDGRREAVRENEGDEGRHRQREREQEGGGGRGGRTFAAETVRFVLSVCKDRDGEEGGQGRSATQESE